MGIDESAAGGVLRADRPRVARLRADRPRVARLREDGRGGAASGGSAAGGAASGRSARVRVARLRADRPRCAASRGPAAVARLRADRPTSRSFRVPSGDDDFDGDGRPRRHRGRVGRNNLGRIARNGWPRNRRPRRHGSRRRATARVKWPRSDEASERMTLTARRSTRSGGSSQVGKEAAASAAQRPRGLAGDAGHSVNGVEEVGLLERVQRPRQRRGSERSREHLVEATVGAEDPGGSVVDAVLELEEEVEVPEPHVGVDGDYGNPSSTKETRRSPSSSSSSETLVGFGHCERDREL
uniref:Uncharacterized protein n=1 Tax=Ananas comosus var. bracteatus TaxID=296719 RepID=A0A6V7QHD3_ANACO|nr:unnamed protein product [Ananas comosus var. bracteatus]